MSKVETYLLDLERLRSTGVRLPIKAPWRFGQEIDLLRKEPREVRKVAAIMLETRVRRRATTEHEVTMSGAEADRLPTTVPKPSDDGEPLWSEVLSERLLEDTCYFCRGAGQGHQLVYENGEKRWVCPVCRGAGVTVRALVARVADFSESLRYPYVPAMLFALEERLTQHFERELAEGDPPECLRIDLSRKLSGGPYRQQVSKREDFFGYDYGDAMPQVRTVVSSILDRPETLAYSVKAWARPILHLRYVNWGFRNEVGTYLDTDGNIQVVVAKRAIGGVTR